VLSLTLEKSGNDFDNKLKRTRSQKVVPNMILVGSKMS